MTRTLDDELANSAPPVRERTPELRAALLELIGDTDRQTGRWPLRASQRTRKIAAGALVATVLLGTGTTAAAAGWVSTPWWEGPASTSHPATSDSGAACSVTYAPRPFTDPAHPVDDADRAAAMRAATVFLRDVDYDALASEDADDTFMLLNERLTESLRRGGYSTHAVSVAVASDCTDGDDR